MKLNDISKILTLIEKPEVSPLAKKAYLSESEHFLKQLKLSIGKRIVIDDFQLLQPWAIAAIAALSRPNNTNIIYVENNKSTPCSKFAHSIGLNEIIKGESVRGLAESGRTVKMRSVIKYEEIEPISNEISHLVISDDEKKLEDEYFDAEEVRLTIRYVMIELLRNVIQHSQDNNGAIILAQLMNKGENNKESFIQIAVVDCGIGIYKSLVNTRHEILSNDMALERSIWPYYSGKFYAYQGGSSQNAGMGLFFVSEMAKLTAGKLLISSKESSLYIEGDPEAQGNNKISLFETGFDGTLVAFEIPKRGVADYDALNKKIIETARERRTKQEFSNWIRFDVPPNDSIEFIINIASENTVEAEKFSLNELLPRIENRQIIVLNFVNMQICTQSYMHSLLFTAIKKAYELKVPIFARNASPSVADGIRLLEMYGL